MIRLLLFCLVISFPCLAINAHGQSAPEWYNKSIDAIFKNKQEKEGIGFVTNALKIDATNANYWYVRGYGYYRLKKDDSAMADINKAIALAPQMELAYRVRALILYHQQNWSEAAADFSKAKQLKPAVLSSSDYMSLAYCQFLGRQYALSAENFTIAFKTDSSDANSYLNRGSCYKSLNQPDKALPDFNRAILLAPGNPVGYQYRGELHYSTKRFKEALEDFEKLTQLLPKDGYAASMLAHAWYNYGLTRDPRETNSITEGKIQKALLLNPKDHTLLNIRGLVWQSMGYKDDKAIGYISEAIKLNPNEPVYYNNRGYLYFEAGKHAEAIADYDKGMQLGGTSFKPYYNFRQQAVSQLAAGAGATAMQLYEEGLRLYKSADKEAAISMMNKAIAKEPNNPRMYFGRYQVAKLTEKEKFIAKALSLEPNNAEYNYYYGLELYLNKQDDKAITYFDKSMSLGGQHLLTQNKDRFGANYKQNILNKRNPIASNNAPKGATDLSNIPADKANEAMRNIMADFKKKTIDQGAGRIIQAGEANESFTTRGINMAHGSSLAIAILHMADRKVEVLNPYFKPAECRDQPSGIFTLKDCYITYNNEQNNKVIGSLRVNVSGGSGNVHYIAYYIDGSKY